MARTPSNMLPLGTPAPSFDLLDTISNKTISIENLRGENGTLIAFICNHCPFVIHINDRMIKLANTYQQKGIGFVAISSNDVENYPQDGPLEMKLQAQKLNYPFPYLYDETQSVAKAFDAACTPDFYLFDEKLSLVYRGQMDDSRPGNDIPNDGVDLENAINCLLNNTPIDKIQKPSIGCNIKWK
ncbi:MAG: thioredoxin family protein [Flavobacteriaceae bacterium]